VTAGPFAELAFGGQWRRYQRLAGTVVREVWV
jgi:hypothetical protein